MMIGSEKLDILLNTLFFSKVFVDSNGIVSLPLSVLGEKIVW